MKNTVAFIAAASAPLLVAAQAPSNLGEALVINKCSYSVPLKNVPAQADGVNNAQEVDVDLAAGSSYSQTWTPLPAGVDGGWSLKLNPLNNADWNNIMQFEYTYTSYSSPNIWYDMSFVNGQPSNFNWEFDVGGVKKTNAYTFATDDANGMQAPVSPETTVTLILCPENGNAGSGSSQPSTTQAPASPATTQAPAPTTTQAPAPTTTQQTTLATSAVPNKAANSPAPSPSTTATTTSAAAPSPPDYDVVTEYATQVVTAFVTETANAAVVMHKRHEHRHPHHHNHF